MSGVTEVRVTRSRDVLEGQILPVTGRLRRHGRLELLVVLPDGTSRLATSNLNPAQLIKFRIFSSAQAILRGQNASRPSRN